MSTPVVIGNATLYLGDCLDILPTLPKVDAVITDPPYSAATHAGARGKGATTGGSHILVDFEAFSPEKLTSIIARLVVSARRWTVVFSDWRLAAHIEPNELVRVGVWVKNDPAPQFTGDRPGTGWESLLILHPKGRKRWNGGGRPAVWRSNICKNGNEHPTQKPDDLMRALVGDFTDQGETILDPFMGSGTTGVAATQMDRAFIGIEREPRYFDIACRRIEDAQRQQPMFAPELQRAVQLEL